MPLRAGACRQRSSSLHAAVLVPGGAVGIIDHPAPAGTDLRVPAVATHRVDAAVVLCDFAAAGFELHADSDPREAERAGGLTTAGRHPG